MLGSHALLEEGLELAGRISSKTNVRELENVIERAMIIHKVSPLRFDDLGLSPSIPANQTASMPEDDTLKLDVLVKSHIQHVVALTGGKIHGPDGAVEVLGLNPNTLRARMKKLSIPFRKKKKNR